MSTAEFCALPNELLVQILAELNLRDLISCSQTCRLLYLTVKHAVILQYNMQLAITGLQDCGSASDLPISERLAEVQIQQESWANLRFRARHLFPVPQYCRVWELCGGVLAHGVCKGYTTRGLRFIKFPSISRGIPGHVWEHPDLGVKIRDFTFDSSQDLVVIVAAKPRGSTQETSHREIYLLAMSSGKKHPLAASVPLTCSLNRDTDKDGDFVIQIMAEFVAVLFHARDVDSKDQLFIWHWKSGKLIIDLMFPWPYQMDAFAFLSPRHFLISRIEPTPLATGPPELQVYDFFENDPQWPTTPRLVRSFQLPQPVAEATVAAMTIRSDPAPRDSLPVSHLEGAPFRTGPSSHLLVITIVIFHPIAERNFARNSFQLFVNSSTLLENAPRLDSTPAETIIPWEAWGPAHSRMLNSISMEITWVCYVHGTRYVTLDRRGPEPRKSRLRMLDFSPFLVKQAQYAKRLDAAEAPTAPFVQESDESNEEAFSTPLKLPESCVVSTSEPTVIRGGRGFRDDVETHLPYRDICSSELFDYRAVMIDEECLVGIHAPLVGGRRVAEVLCF